MVKPLVVLALLALPAFPAAAEEPAAAPSYSMELYTGLMSPYCPGRSLMDCPSSQATELREWIHAQEQAGRSRQEVEEQLYRQFGDVILQAPRAQGIGLAAYLLPILAFFAGGAVVVLFLRRQRAAAATAARPVPPLPIDPEIERRIDDELRA
jgi:cytochrome c-type biogenesis protein CcmH/NrfF